MLLVEHWKGNLWCFISQGEKEPVNFSVFPQLANQKQLLGNWAQNTFPLTSSCTELLYTQTRLWKTEWGTWNNFGRKHNRKSAVYYMIKVQFSSTGWMNALCIREKGTKSRYHRVTWKCSSFQLASLGPFINVQWACSRYANQTKSESQKRKVLKITQGRWEIINQWS